MKPITFGSCVGWLHEGQTKQGVILCESLGHEASWTHKLMRAIAERLAREGVAVLRFSYPGTGDSAGDDRDAGRHAASIASIHDAIDLLRDEVGVTDLTLVGIRAGALFALLAAASMSPSPRVDALVALAPVVRGRAYLRELSFMHRQWLDTTSPAIRLAHRDEPCMNVLGHRFPADFVDALKAVDLCDIVHDAPTLPGAMLLIQPDQGDGPALRDALLARGVEVASEPFHEWATTMLDGTRSRLPLAAIDTLVNWIAERAPRMPVVAETHLRADPVWSGELAVALDMNDMTEQFVAVGPDRLVGVLCRPAETRPENPAGPAVVIANTSTNPRSGEGRFSVRLARALARVGVTTLRIDVNGVGDSGPNALDDQSGVVYSAQSIDDVAAAADWLRALGHLEVVAAGICSGAYAALHAAVKTPSLGGVIAINLARFVWPSGLTLEAVQKQRNNSVRGYWLSVRDWQKWRRLVRERRDLRPIVSAVAANAVARISVPVKGIAARVGWKPRIDTPRGVMRELEQRNVWTTLVYGALDPGIDDVRRHFGAIEHAFQRSRHVRLHLKSEIDHAVYGAVGTDIVIDLCMQALGRETGRPVARVADPAAPEAAGRSYAKMSVGGP
ncbi:serine aminopeptidase domain-containing protein [Burkholderia catarinensis]|uniref:serine aminopeptidase domain-containing protein n=1 Tax=Burkholderia catarinensis TaxID=1108140 RepID=UPI000916E2D8|nr:alpha/beta hydrolase [Burkholderia catarinensis]KAG8154305.1 alpha/beta hydrolase [Burkholderia catarinensis]